MTENMKTLDLFQGLVGSMPLQLLEIGFHVEIHAIEWHDFQHETQFHGSCSGMNRIFSRS